MIRSKKAEVSLQKSAGRKHISRNTAYFVYMLQCADDSFYTGIARDLKKRLRQHNGEVRGGAKYTRSHRPVRLAYSEIYKTRSRASAREHEIKTMTRPQKMTLIFKKPKVLPA